MKVVRNPCKLIYLLRGHRSNYFTRNKRNGIQKLFYNKIIYVLVYIMYTCMYSI